MSNAEICLLLRLAPLSLIPFIESIVVPIQDNLCVAAKKIDEDHPTYVIIDPLKSRFK